MNKIGDSVSPCLTPFKMLIFSLKDSVLIWAVPPLYVSFSTLMYFSCTPWCFSAVKTALCWMEVKAFS